MVDHKFVVGKEEKQRIRIHHVATTGKITIIVNGKPIITVDGRELRPLSRGVESITVGFVIGEKEKHKLSLRIRGAFWNHFEAYSDNEMVYRS